jgi:ABC-type uncharacterized transport system substrate-binding protein
VRFEERWADNAADRLHFYVAELVRLASEAIFVSSSPSLRAMQKATRDIPIVFASIVDPVRKFGDAYRAYKARVRRCDEGNVT